MGRWLQSREIFKVFYDQWNTAPWPIRTDLELKQEHARPGIKLLVTGLWDHSEVLERGWGLAWDWGGGEVMRFLVLCWITQCHRLNSSNGPVPCGKPTQELAQRRRLLAVQTLGCSAMSLHPTCDFSHDCNEQSHQLTVSYLKHYCLSICCLRAVNTLQLSPEMRGTNRPWVNPKPVWGRGETCWWDILPHFFQ